MRIIKTLDFGTWAEFVSHDWRDPSAVKELTIRWDFLIKIEAYAQPQRHTLTVNFKTGMNPAALLRIVLDAVNAPQEIDMSKMFSGCVARVDFISHALADELLALVGKWHSTLPKGESVGTFLEKCEKNDKLIANLIKYSLPISASVIVYFVLLYLSSFYQLNSILTVKIMRDFCLWIFGTFILLWAASKTGKFIANRTYQAITFYGAHHTFRFTSGDIELMKKLEEKNKKTASRFIFSICETVILHIFAGLIVYYLSRKTLIQNYG